jgi:mTERF domain-containing protein
MGAFKQYPLVLVCFEKTIIVNPKFLMYSTAKRLCPKYDVLASMKLIEEARRIGWLLTISKKKFLVNYVNKYAAKVPGLLQIYMGR